MTLAENQFVADRYRIVEHLGEGTTGQVYRVWDTARQDEIALKILHPDLVSDPATFTQSTAVLSRIASLHHPGLVSVFDYKFVDDQAVICQEYVTGTTLDRILASAKLALPAVKPLISQLLAAVDYASTGTPMLSLNARNVWITRGGDIRITDAGLPALAPVNATLNLARQHRSECYLAPEWHRVTNTSELSSATDQFALGVLLIELLLGRKISASHLVSSEPELANIGPLAPIIARMTNPEPESRFASISDAKHAIETTLLRNQKRRFNSFIPFASHQTAWRFFQYLIALALVIGIALCIRWAAEPQSLNTRLEADLATLRASQDELRSESQKLTLRLLRFPQLAPTILNRLHPGSRPYAEDSLQSIATDLRQGRSDIAVESIADSKRRLSNRRKQFELINLGLTRIEEARRLGAWYEQLTGSFERRFRSREDSLNTSLAQARSSITSGYFSTALQSLSQAVTLHQQQQGDALKELLETAEHHRDRYQQLFKDDGLPLVELNDRSSKRIDRAKARLREGHLIGATIDLQIAIGNYHRWTEAWSTIPPPDPGHHVNSLGMRFIDLGPFQASVWETRRYEFAVFARTSGHDVRRLWYENHARAGLTHPVASVTRYDAQQFCLWLTRREQASGQLGPHQHYRLPTDQEWSYLAGLEREEGRNPEERSWAEQQIFPWGPEPIRTADSGNYDTWPSATPENNFFGYMDPWLETAPVGQFPPNPHGLYDVGGNVWEWVSDTYNDVQETKTARGGGWRTMSLLNMRTQARQSFLYANSTTGFRVIIAPVNSPSRTMEELP
jgi:serine/threonine protein kinase